MSSNTNQRKRISIEELEDKIWTCLGKNFRYMAKLEPDKREKNNPNRWMG